MQKDWALNFYVFALIAVKFHIINPVFVSVIIGMTPIK